MWNVRRGALLNEGRCRPEECDVERRLAAAILRVDGGAVAEEELNLLARSGELDGGALRVAGGDEVQERLVAAAGHRVHSRARFEERS